MTIVAHKEIRVALTLEAATVSDLDAAMVSLCRRLGEVAPTNTVALSSRRAVRVVRLEVLR